MHQYFVVSSRELFKVLPNGRLFKNIRLAVCGTRKKISAGIKCSRILKCQSTLGDSAKCQPVKK